MWGGNCRCSISRQGTVGLRQSTQCMTCQMKSGPHCSPCRASLGSLSRDKLCLLVTNDDNHHGPDKDMWTMWTFCSYMGSMHRIDFVLCSASWCLVASHVCSELSLPSSPFTTSTSSCQSSPGHQERSQVRNSFDLSRWKPSSLKVKTLWQCS